MTDSNPEPADKRGNSVAITFIYAATIVFLTCILACAGIMVTFLLNPPW